MHLNTQSGWLGDSWIHDITGAGLVTTFGCSTVGCLITNCTTYGIAANYSSMISHNTIYGCGAVGILVNFVINTALYIRSNVVAGCGIGIKYNNTGAVRAAGNFDGNVFYNNTTDQSFYNDTSTGTNADGHPYVPKARDVLTAAFSGSPFVSTASSGAANWGLNSTAEARAVLRGVPSVPQTIGAASTTLTYADPGAAQHQDAGAQPACSTFRTWMGCNYV